MKFRKSFSYLALGACLGLGWVGKAAAEGSYTGNHTTCVVLTEDDNDGSIRSLRRHVNVFNRGSEPENDRDCTEWIYFINYYRPNEVMTIKLKERLRLYADDAECSSEEALCRDGINLLLDGSTHPQGVVIDTTALKDADKDQDGAFDEKCAIEVSSSGMKMQGITLLTNQVKKLTKDPDHESAVICDKGENNNFDGVNIKNPDGVGTCGDGVVQTGLGEECDDGPNNGANRSCSSACTKNPDSDEDGILDAADNCPNDKNPDQADCDGDGKGDKCDDDYDNDSIPDGGDNCPPDRSICSNPSLPERQAVLQQSYNPKAPGASQQSDIDQDTRGDQCDDDMDGDGIVNGSDNCEAIPNPDQEDHDQDGLGTVCDSNDVLDTDSDGVNDAIDNCLEVANGAAQDNQLDTDGDGMGDACDVDKDNDGITNDAEAAVCTSPIALDPLKKDSDGDGRDDGSDLCPCDPDLGCGIIGGPNASDVDDDGIENVSDNCPSHSNAAQEDADGDGIGDACDLDNADADTDKDGVKNGEDNCASIANSDQANQDGDSLGDACDPAPDQSAEGATGTCRLNAFASSNVASWILWAAVPMMAGALRGLRRRK